MGRFESLYRPLRLLHKSDLPPVATHRDTTLLTPHTRSRRRKEIGVSRPRTFRSFNHTPDTHCGLFTTRTAHLSSMVGIQSPPRLDEGFVLNFSRPLLFDFLD